MRKFSLKLVVQSGILFLPRHTGNVLIETGVIGCPWLLVSFSEHVSCRKSGDFTSCPTSASPSNSISLAWLSESDISCISSCWTVPSSKKMSASSEASESTSLSRSENDSGADWKVEKKEGNTLFVLLQMCKGESGHIVPFSGPQTALDSRRSILGLEELLWSIFPLLKKTLQWSTYADHLQIHTVQPEIPWDPSLFLRMILTVTKLGQTEDPHWLLSQKKPPWTCRSWYSVHKEYG